MLFELLRHHDVQTEKEILFRKNLQWLVLLRTFHITKVTMGPYPSIVVTPFRTSSNIAYMSAGTALALIMSHTQPDTSSLHTDREETEAASLSASTERNIDKRINDILGMASNVMHCSWHVRCRMPHSIINVELICEHGLKPSCQIH